MNKGLEKIARKTLWVWLPVVAFIRLSKELLEKMRR